MGVCYIGNKLAKPGKRRCLSLSITENFYYAVICEYYSLKNKKKLVEVKFVLWNTKRLGFAKLWIKMYAIMCQRRIKYFGYIVGAYPLK